MPPGWRLSVAVQAIAGRAGERAGRFLVALGVSALLAVADAPSGVAAAVPPVPTVGAAAAVLYDAQTGQVLYQKNDQTLSPPASITKLLTALVVLHHIRNLDRMVTITAADVNAGGSSAPMVAGERLSVRNLLYGLLLVSGNDSADALANATAGSIPAFAAMMNAQAAAVGVTRSHFVDPSGLSAPGHLVTALDMARIAAAVLRQPEEVRILATKVLERYPMPSGPPQPMVNQDQLLWTYPGIVAGKIGFTDQAGNTMVAMARRHGMTLVAVVLHDVPWLYWNDEARLLDYGFGAYRRVVLLRAGTRVATLPVLHAADRKVALVTVRPVAWDVPQGPGPAVSTVLATPRHAPAGRARGTVVGSAEVLAGGRTAAVVAVALAAKTPRPARPPAQRYAAVAFGGAAALVLVAVATGIGGRRGGRRHKRRRYRLRRDSVWLRLAGGARP